MLPGIAGFSLSHAERSLCIDSCPSTIRVKDVLDKVVQPIDLASPGMRVYDWAAANGCHERGRRL
jgi:hypothetical protein